MRTEAEFTALARRYMDMIFRLAYSQTKSRADADDVTQNVLLALFRTDKAFESEEHLKRWLLRVTMNECRRLWRSPWSKTEDIETYAKAAAAEDPQRGELFRAIMALDKRCRAVIVLHYYEGYSVAETAALLGIPPGTVGTRLKRAREKLRDYLKEAEEI